MQMPFAQQPALLIELARVAVYHPVWTAHDELRIRIFFKA